MHSMHLSCTFRGCKIRPERGVGGVRMFEINDPQVVSETIDGEVVIVNMERGTYFSIRGTGTHVWSALLIGLQPQEIAQSIKGMNVDAEAASEDVERFVETLLAEGLLRHRKDPIRREDATNVCTVPSGAYEPPELEKFTDMMSLLLLDPIHDVDEKGWPHLQ